MFKKFLLAAALALPLGILPAAEVKADAPTSALQTTVQTVENAANQNVRVVRTWRTVRYVSCYRHGCHHYRGHHYRR
jgi:hypothetical protein